MNKKKKLIEEKNIEILSQLNKIIDECTRKSEKDEIALTRIFKIMGMALELKMLILQNKTIKEQPIKPKKDFPKGFILGGETIINKPNIKIAKRPNKKDYDFNDIFDSVSFSKSMIDYADYLEKLLKTCNNCKLYNGCANRIQLNWNTCASWERE